MDPDPVRKEALEAAGAEVVRVARAGAGLDLNWVLGLLWEQGIRSVFCEGGPRLAGALARAGRLDRLQILVAPVLLGADALNAFDALPAPERMRLQLERVQRFGRDVLLAYERVEGEPAQEQTTTADEEGYVYRPG